MRGRALTVRLRQQAERLLRDLEAAPQVDQQKLAEALALVARAREERRIRWCETDPPSGPPPERPPRSPRTPPPERTAKALKAWRTRWRREEARRREKGEG